MVEGCALNGLVLMDLEAVYATLRIPLTDQTPINNQ